MDQENSSESNQQTFSALNHILASPQFVPRNGHDVMGEGQQRGHDWHFVPTRGNHNPRNYGRQSRTPLMRTPQIGRNDRQHVSHSPLADLDFGNPFYPGYGDISTQSPQSHRHRHRSRNLIHDQSSNPLAVPIERGVSHVKKVMFNGFSMIGPFRSSGDHITMQEHIPSPNLERRTERVSFNLRKMNFFKAQQSTAFPRHSKERDRDSTERPEPETAPTPRTQKPRTRARRLEKQSRKTRMRSPYLKQPKITCFCKKSNCKKEYCHCFKNKVPCNSKCGCFGCNNDTCFPENNNTLNKPNHSTLFPPGSRFVPLQGLYRAVPAESVESPVVQRPETQLFRSCNCRKSYCQKKYCDCFSQGRRCTALCHCDGCINK